MSTDETTPAEGLALSAEEVGARVSAILAAAERDARAVIDAAHRQAAAASESEPVTLEQLARAVDDLRLRVEALERGDGGSIPVELAPAARAAEATPDPSPGDGRDDGGAASEAAARVLAIDLALAGYSRDAIAHELGVSLGRSDVDRLLDEVLAH